MDQPIAVAPTGLVGKDGEQFVHVRSTDGAGGLPVAVAGRDSGELVIPFFLGRDARASEAELLFELYRDRSSY